VLAVRSEAADEEDVKTLWAKVKAEIGVIDVLICNAGVLGELPDFPLIGKRKPSDWWSDMVGRLYI
jgi:NAD(P)-dependent dehydrogenase (short-subunit alcohol dehydrogenase family)